MSALRHACFVALLCSLLLTLAPAVQAQPSLSADLQIAVRPDGVHLAWQGRLGRDRAGAPLLEGWPLVEFGGVQLPARLIALRVAGAAPVTPQIERLAHAAWSGALTASPAPTPQTSSGALRPALARATSPAVPSAPIVVLRDGRLRGERIVVLAVSPLFQTEGALQAASQITATIPGVTLFDPDSASLDNASGFVQDAPVTNPAASGQSWTIDVAQAGVQRLTGAQLAAAGLDLAALDPARLHVRGAGVDLALDLRGSGDGRLDPADELRFYAPAPGDRWNAITRYWLTVEAGSAPRMTSRSVLPKQGALSASAIEAGVWRANALYDSTLAGPDGDHWFAVDLRSGPGQPAVSYDLTLTPRLPLVSGPASFTVSGSSYTAGQHALTLQRGGATASATWSGAGDWTHTFTLDGSSVDLRLTLNPGAALSGFELDSIDWRLPVALALGEQGATFQALDAAPRYQLSNSLADRALYDISDPAAPALLTLPSQLTPQFQFEDAQAGRSYLLTGSATLHTPLLRAHTPVDLRPPLDADVLYIAPAVFHAALEPLIVRRAAQGYHVRLVDVQAIYDAWSYGQVAPEAIRAFLRHAAATWSRAPRAVTLVGDGASDPLNYTGRNNATFIPPYLAPVDLWIGETACEFCFAQLDGSDPRADPLPDLALGRLPVKSAAELQTVVAKIIGYETSSSGIDWRARALYIADNADSAGDFAAYADQSAALQPPGVAIQRLYYDPSASPTSTPWREPDALRARQRTLDALSAGAGLVSYIGHSHQWQWAVTDPATPPGALLSLYDIDTLTNADRLSIVLEMTCYTSAFQQPAYSGTTIDERLLLHPGGGAVATWGPTGLGVAHGHDALQRGFFRALWQAPRMSATLGSLTLAGDLELFTAAGCCQDTIQTFALLGDPLTTARVLPAARSYLPVARR
jgi:hypothetical protein